MRDFKPLSLPGTLLSLLLILYQVALASAQLRCSQFNLTAAAQGLQIPALTSRIILEALPLANLEIRAVGQAPS